MNKYILRVDGMRCGMCEAHVEEVIRNNIKVKKIRASHIKNEVTIICEDELNLDDFKKILDPTGYKILSIEKLKAEKKILGWV